VNGAWRLTQEPIAPIPLREVVGKRIADDRLDGGCGGTRGFQPTRSPTIPAQDGGDPEAGITSRCAVTRDEERPPSGSLSGISDWIFSAVRMPSSLSGKIYWAPGSASTAFRAAPTRATPEASIGVTHEDKRSPVIRVRKWPRGARPGFSGPCCDRCR
jgi:hypothetical protein